MVPTDYDDYQPTETEIRDEVLAIRAMAARSIKTAKTAVAKTERKVDPRLVAMSRELRDRWTERADLVPALPGKCDVRRAIADNSEIGGRAAFADAAPTAALPEAA